MLEVLVIAFIFALMPLMITCFKMKTSLAMFLCCLLVQLFLVRSAQGLLKAITDIAEFSSVNTILCVVLIGVVSKLMKSYGLLDDIVDSAKALLSSRRFLLGAIPMAFGLLSVPGGAYMSAPFVGKLGDEIGMPKARMAAINLTFRHDVMFLSPFSNFCIYVIGAVPGLNVFHLIALNIPFAAALIVTGIKCYIPKGEIPPVKNDKQKVDVKKNLKKLLRGFSPILLVIFLNAAFGLPMFVTFLFAIGLIFLLAPKKDFLKTAISGVQLDVALILVSVFFVRNTILQLANVLSLISSLFSSSSDLLQLLVIIVGSMFLGCITGQYYVALGIFLPILAQTANVPITQLFPLIAFIGWWGVFGYYYSPLHPCQVLTLQYFGVSPGAVYREHFRQAPWVMLSTVVLFFAYRLIFG